MVLEQGATRDPWDQDFHEFRDHEDWKFIEQLWGSRALFLRVGEVLTFLRPLQDSTHLTEADVYAIVMAAATEAENYVFYPSDIPRDQLPDDYPQRYVLASLRTFRERIYHPKQSKAALDQPGPPPDDPVVDAVTEEYDTDGQRMPTVVSTHQIPDILLRLAQRRYPRNEEALELFLDDVYNYAIPSYETYIQERRLVRETHWRKTIWKAKAEAEQKRNKIREKLRKERIEQGGGFVTSSTGFGSQTTSKGQEPMEIPKVTGTIVGLEDGDWYLLDNGEVEAENRPAFLKHLNVGDKGVSQEGTGDTKQEDSNDSKSEVDSVRTQTPPNDWDSDDSEKDQYSSDDEGYVGFQRRMNAKQVMCVICDFGENLQKLFHKLKNHYHQVVYFQTIFEAQQPQNFYNVGMWEFVKAVGTSKEATTENDKPMRKSLEELKRFVEHNSKIAKEWVPSERDTGIQFHQFVYLLLKIADTSYASDLKELIADKTNKIDTARNSLLMQTIENSLQASVDVEIPVKKKVERLQTAMIQALSRQPTTKPGRKPNKSRGMKKLLKAKESQLPSADSLHVKLMMLFALLGLHRHDVPVKDLYESALVAASQILSTELKASAEAEYASEKAVAELQQKRKAEEDEGTSSGQGRHKSGSGGKAPKDDKANFDNAQKRKEEEQEEAAAAEKAMRKTPNLIRLGNNANVCFPSWNPSSTAKQSSSKKSMGGSSASTTSASDEESDFDAENQFEETRKDLMDTEKNKSTYENLGIGFGTHVPSYKEIKPPPKKATGKDKKKGGGGSNKGRAKSSKTEEEETPQPWVWDEASSGRRLEFRLSQRQTADAYDDRELEKHELTVLSSKNKTGTKGKKKKKAAKGYEFPPTGTLGDQYGMLSSPNLNHLKKTSPMRAGATMSGKTTAPISTLGAKLNAVERDKEAKARRQQYAREMAKYKKELKDIEKIEEEVEQERKDIQKKYKNNPDQMPELPQPPPRPPMPERPKTPPMKEKPPSDFFIDDVEEDDETLCFSRKLTREERDGQKNAILYINEQFLKRAGRARAKRKKQMEEKDKSNAKGKPARQKAEQDDTEEYSLGGQKPKVPSKNLATSAFDKDTYQTSTLRYRTRIFRTHRPQSAHTSSASGEGEEADWTVSTVARPGITTRSPTTSRGDHSKEAKHDIDPAGTFLKSISEYVKTDTTDALEQDLRKFKRLLTGEGTATKKTPVEGKARPGQDSLRNVPPTATIEEGKWAEKLQTEMLEGESGKKGAKEKKTKPKPPLRAAAAIVNSNDTYLGEMVDRPRSATSRLPTFVHSSRTDSRKIFPPLGGVKTEETIAGFQAQRNGSIQHQHRGNVGNMTNDTDYWTSHFIPPHARPVIVREGQSPEVKQLLGSPDGSTDFEEYRIYIPSGAVSGLLNSAEIYHNDGKYSEAAKSYMEALKHWKQDQSTFTTGAEMYIRLCLSSVYESQNKDAVALEQTLMLLSLCKELDEHHPFRSATLMRLGYQSFYKGELKLAGRCWARALSSRREIFGPRHWATAVTAANLASAMLLGGEHGEGVVHLIQAHRILFQQLGSTHPFTETVMRNLDKARTCFSGTLSDQLGNSGRRPVETSTRADLHRLCLNGNYQVHVSKPLVDPFARGGGGGKKKKKKK